MKEGMKLDELGGGKDLGGDGRGETMIRVCCIKLFSINLQRSNC